MKTIKILFVCITIIMLLTVMPLGTITAGATDISGTTGDCTWLLDGTTLTISGKGKMKDYSISFDAPPWIIYDITKVIINEGVTSIGDWSFCETGITNILIPKSVKTIGCYAFSCTNLVCVTIPKTVTYIGENAFEGCSNLKNITIPDSDVLIESGAFSPTAYYSDRTNWENGALYIGNHLIEVETVDSGEFCVRDGTKTIASYAFNNHFNKVGHPSGFTKITIPDSVTSIGVGAFYYCTNLTSIVLSNNISKIPDYAFASCYNLKSIIIPNGVTAIGKQAFVYCKNLKNITMPGSVASLGANAFYDCNNIENVYYCGSEVNKRAIKAPYGWNGEIYDSKWHYNSCIEKTNHTYSNSCDKSCNICNAIRTIKHTYTNSCDTTCNVCKAKRTIKHTYSNNCDASCNVCKATRTITHAYKTTTTKATLTKNGSIIKKCTVCGKVASNTAIKYAKTFKLSTTAYTYNGGVKTPTVTVKDSAGETLKKNNDYTVTYASGRKNAGTYKVTVKMIGKYSGTKTLTFKINPIDISKCKLSLSATSYTYNGAVRTPTVTVKNASGTKLTKNTHYTATYASGRKNAGTYKVTVKMKGNYTGTKTLTFKINPTKTTVSKLTAGKKSITVAITKKSTQVTGYQIQYSTSKAFSKATTKTISSYNTTKYTLKSLSAKKTYYVRVRTYKKVGSTTYYSSWSTYKYVKTK